MVDTFDTFVDALESTGFDTPEEAMENGLSICGARRGVRSVYFVVDKRDDEPSEQDLHDIAFQAVEGREVSDYERWLRGMVEKVGVSA